MLMRLKNIKSYALFIFFGLSTLIYSKPGYNRRDIATTPPLPTQNIVIQMVQFDGNNINSWVYNTGIFDQDRRTSNTPGFEWPIYTGQDAVFTDGLTIAGIYNGVIRMASAMYAGEYAPGYITDSAGIPVAKTDSRFKVYSVKRTDSYLNNTDWLNWGLMVPYGAPFTDVNHNGTYEPAVDTPGVKNASQTIFICLTDGFPEQHSVSEGFGGGTLPLFAELHTTIWCFDNPDLSDVQFFRWQVINKSHTNWNSFYCTMTCDPDLGCADDDFIGCDTTRNLGFCYNSNEIDCAGSYRYTGVVPSVGFLWLRCNNQNAPIISSMVYFIGPSSGGPMCETDPNPDIPGAYNYMKGIKKDATPWVIPPGGPSNITKFCYSGDPETGNGWCERQGTISGSVQNCGGPNVTTGTIVTANYGGDRRLVMSSGSDNLTIHPADTQTVTIAQLIARGTNRRNSVTMLKILADTVRANCNRGFIIGVNENYSRVPDEYSLKQNYPNPFNPKTIISYTLPKSAFVVLTIYDILGRELQIPVNEKQSAGTYNFVWDGTGLPSGVYFYKIKTGSFEQTKKMVLLK